MSENVLRTILLAAVLTLTGCTVNVPDPSPDRSPSQGAERVFPDLSPDERFDKAYETQGFDQRHDRETTRKIARSLCAEIEAQGSVQGAMLTFIRMDDEGTLDGTYMGKLMAISVISYCPEYTDDIANS